MKSITPDNVLQFAGEWSTPDWCEWLQEWKTAPPHSRVTELLEQLIEKEKANYADVVHLLRLYQEHHPAGILRYLPLLNRIALHSTAADYSLGEHASLWSRNTNNQEWEVVDDDGRPLTLQAIMDNARAEATITYYRADKHNWEIKTKLLQLLHYSTDEDLRAFIRRNFPELLKEPLPAEPVQSAQIQTTNIRYQLTLFLPEQIAATVQAFRMKYNPVQAALIAPHVTLCRENELAQLTEVLHQVSIIYQPPLSIEFGTPELFAEGKGLWVPSAGTAFNELRHRILKGSVKEMDAATPHITLVHPRNGTCTPEAIQAAAMLPFPASVTFSGCALIKQEDGKAWETIREFLFLH